jgi:hypothetical protein
LRGKDSGDGASNLDRKGRKVKVKLTTAAKIQLEAQAKEMDAAEKLRAVTVRTTAGVEAIKIRPTGWRRQTQLIKPTERAG